MITPFQTITDEDMRSRATALRASGYACSKCRRPKINPLSVEVYHTDRGTAVVLCRSCARRARFVAILAALFAPRKRRGV